MNIKTIIVFTLTAFEIVYANTSKAEYNNYDYLQNNPIIQQSNAELQRHQERNNRQTQELINIQRQQLQIMQQQQNQPQINQPYQKRFNRF